MGRAAVARVVIPLATGVVVGIVIAQGAKRWNRIVSIIVVFSGSAFLPSIATATSRTATTTTAGPVTLFTLTFLARRALP